MWINEDDLPKEILEELKAKQFSEALKYSEEEIERCKELGMFPVFKK